MNNQQLLQQAQQNSGRSMQGKSEDDPMNVDANIIFDDYRKQVSDLEWSNKIKDAQIKNLQQALQEAKDKVAKLDKPTKATNK